MGVVNVTPDSFSDGGLHAGTEQAVAHAGRLLGEGADILDIGGESTRPGSATVGLDEERRRVLPVLRALAGCGVPLSVDTRKPELMAEVVSHCDVVITTAAVPGKKSPVLVTADMVKAMAPGSVIVDLAAERGGNCELTQADREVVVGGVRIFGPTNLPSTVPQHASQMYSNNVVKFLQNMVKDGQLVCWSCGVKP